MKLRENKVEKFKSNSASPVPKCDFNKGDIL